MRPSIFPLVAAFALAIFPLGAQTFSDPLLPAAGRDAGALLNQADATGGGKWRAVKSVTITGEGASSKTPGGAHLTIPVIAGIIRIEADIDAKGSGFTGLTLGRGDLSGNFWENLGVMLTVLPQRFNIFAAKKDIIADVDKSLMHEGTNHFEFIIDTVKRTTTVRINGKAAVDNLALPEGTRLDQITAAGFHFNEPMSGSPSVKNFKVELNATAVAGLQPLDHAMCFVIPGENATLTWKAAGSGPSKEVPYFLNDYRGVKIGEGKAGLADDGTVSLQQSFPQGYTELVFPEAGQTFGIVSLAKQEGAADPFFSIDAGLSWLERDRAKRDALVRIMARCGISMARERLGVANVTQTPGKYNWGTARNFDTMRKTYQDNHVQILEILDGGKHGNDLARMSGTLADLAKHWTVWGGAEASNEPDLRPMPADHYVPLSKVMSYAMKQAAAPAPVVSGAFATIPPGPYFDTCAANGMLEDSDAVSFHSYDRAPGVEGMVARYRTWLKGAGKETMPLWHTECGWPWLNGPARPPQLQDADSAMEISAKAVESRAAGVARYFPFVMTYYEEGLKNFGMMGREVSPLRSMAAYANCIRTLGGKAYLGDLTGLDTSVKLTRVFGGKDSRECVAILYTGKVDPEMKVAFPFKVKKAEGADGRTIEAVGGMLPITDGILYVTMELSDAKASLNTDTSVRRLYEIGGNPLVQKRRAAPIVLQFLADKTPARASARRYLISTPTAREFPLNVRVHNLSEAPLEFTPELSLPGKPSETKPAVTVPAEGFIDLSWTLDVTSSLDIAKTKLISVSGKSSGGIQPLPVAIPVVMEGDLEQHLASHPNKSALPITDLPRWEKNIAGHGRSTFSVSTEGAWKMDLNFSGKAGNWTYPRMKLPEKIDTGKYSGFLVRGRIMKAGDTVAILAGTPNAPGFWVSDVFPADGEWHVVYVPFAEFKPGPGGAGNQNTRLNPAAWATLGIGMNSRSPENTMEVSHFMLVGGGGE